jgi:hypothetical protein
VQWLTSRVRSDYYERRGGPTLWEHRAVPVSFNPERVPTATLAAAGLMGGFAIAVETGSRPLGGLFMAACGLPCIAVWLQRDGRGTAAGLTATGLVAFAASHVVGHAIGAWPAVILVSAVTAGACWRFSDSRRGEPAVSRPSAADSPRTARPADQPEPSA